MKTFKDVLTPYLSLDEILGHSEGPPESSNRVSSVRRQLLRTCNGIPTETGVKYPIRGFSVEFPKKKQTLQLTGLLTGNRLQGARKEKVYYDVDAVFSFDAAFNDTNLGFVERGDST